MTDPRTPDPILDLLGGKARAQAVSTAAAIGAPDALLDGPLDLDQLAARLSCERGPLESLMRLLAGLGLFGCPSPGVFELTAVGRRLCADDLGPLATYLGAKEQWDPWSRLRDAMTPADADPAAKAANAFEHTFGTTLYDYLAATPPAADRYDAAIDSFTRHEAAQLCDAYDFANAQHVVDVGGGRGSLLRGVLDRWPHLRGTLFDLPHVVNGARADLEQRFPGRVQAVGGDLFAAEDQPGIPTGADHYLVKHVLHNWPDDQAVDILRRCARAGCDGARILAIDAILAPDTRPDMAALLDLEMRVLTGGRQRRKPEIRRLFQQAGLKLEALTELTDAGWLMVARAR